MKKYLTLVFLAILVLNPHIVYAFDAGAESEFVPVGSDKKTNKTIDDDTSDEISLVVSADGPTKSEAIVLALRSAIEEAFGAFVSSNTSILNDELVKDEIATVTSGNIKSYKEISSTSLENGNFLVTVQAIVSIKKLISYAESHGATVEFSGQAFVMQEKLRKLNKENEKKALEHLWVQLTAISRLGLNDYEVEMNDPALYGSDKYKIEGKVRIIPNKNTDALFSAIKDVLGALSLSKETYNSYRTRNFEAYRIRVMRMRGSSFFIKEDGKIEDETIFYLQNPFDMERVRKMLNGYIETLKVQVNFNDGEIMRPKIWYPADVKDLYNRSSNYRPFWVFDNSTLAAPDIGDHNEYLKFGFLVSTEDLEKITSVDAFDEKEPESIFIPKHDIKYELCNYKDEAFTTSEEWLQEALLMAESFFEIFDDSLNYRVAAQKISCSIDAIVKAMQGVQNKEIEKTEKLEELFTSFDKWAQNLVPFGVRYFNENNYEMSFKLFSQYLTYFILRDIKAEDELFNTIAYYAQLSAVNQAILELNNHRDSKEWLLKSLWYADAACDSSEFGLEALKLKARSYGQLNAWEQYKSVVLEGREKYPFDEEIKSWSENIGI